MSDTSFVIKELLYFHMKRENYLFVKYLIQKWYSHMVYISPNQFEFD